MTDTPTPDLTASEAVERFSDWIAHNASPTGIDLWNEAFAALSAKLEAAETENLTLHEANEGLGSAAWEATKRAEAAETERDAALGVLDGIAIYGADTLSGNARGPDNRAWQRAAVVEMTKRAQAARQKGGEG